MGMSAFIRPFIWSRYSKKLIQRIENPHNVGFFDAKESENRGMRLVVGEQKDLDEGNHVAFFILVDVEDGMIVDAKFQILGQSALIGAAEALCTLVARKNYDQAKRIGADLIDKQLRDRANIAAFPKEAASLLNLALDALDEAIMQCEDIPLSMNYVAPPTPTEVESLEGGFPGFEQLKKEQKLAVIEDILNEEIRPYIALDGGGVELIDCEGKEVKIAYQGNCTSCFSAVGATLSYIQQVIQAKVSKDLTVVPEQLPF